MKVKAGYLEVNVDGSVMPVYHAHPRDQRGDCGVLVFQEAFGVNGHIQDICHRLAHEGYEVFAPELFHRFGKHLTFEYSDRATAITHLGKMNKEQLIRDTGAALDFISELPELQLQGLASIGFCIGGYTSILAAEFFPLTTAISFYGAGLIHPRPGIGLLPIAEDFDKIRSPLLLIYGEIDASIPLSEVGEIETRLKDAGVSAEQIIFPDSNHGFFCSQRGSYNAEAAHAAWDISLKWLNQRFYSMAERSSSVSSGNESSAAGTST